MEKKLTDYNVGAENLSLFQFVKSENSGKNPKQQIFMKIPKMNGKLI